jgi:hypothetical protein
MAADNGGSFPYAGLAVVALFVSAAFLAPHGIQLLRQNETDTGQRFDSGEPPVEARLWEDPLYALHRHSEKRTALCSKLVPDTTPDPQRAQATDQRTVLSAACIDADPTKIGDLRKTYSSDNPLTVLAVLVPGGTFLGAGEARRRSRYALLSGLNAAGFVPENSERMGWVRLPRCRNLACTPELEVDPANRQTEDEDTRRGSTEVDVVYETFASKIERPDRRTGPQRRVMVLWIDDSALGRRWLTGVAAMLAGLQLPKEAQLRLLGPTTSDAMVHALRNDLPAHFELAKKLALIRPPPIDSSGPKRDAAVGPPTEATSPVDAKPPADAKQPPDTRQASTLQTDGADKREGSKAVPQTPPTETFEHNWKILVRLRLISPAATTPARQLLSEVRLADEPAIKAVLDSSTRPRRAPRAGDGGKDPVPDSPIDFAIRHRLDQIREIYGKTGQPEHFILAAPAGEYFQPTIGSDDLLIARLTSELCGRGLDLRAHATTSRIALLSEWDSLYSRSFAVRLEKEARCNDGKHEIAVEKYEYLRGLDGMTLDAGSKQTKPGDDKTRASDKVGDSQGAGPAKVPPIEWPEGRDQRDYLRRLIEQRLAGNDPRRPDSGLQAIGIVGYDVHDKLVLAQALRDAFADRMIFTTDLDARLLHPSMMPYTRNIVVASSLPLAFDDPDLQCRIPPFRDSYQTAMFLAARLAATEDHVQGHGCLGMRGDELRERIAEEITKVRLYEIGRDGLVELVAPGYAPRTPEAKRQPLLRTTYATLGICVVILLGVLMTLGWPGPAMAAARGRWLWDVHRYSPGASGAAGTATLTRAAAPRPGEAGELRACSVRSTMIVSGLEVAALGFAAGVMVELGRPGSMGIAGAVSLAVASAGFFWAFLYPGTSWIRGFRAALVQRPAKADETRRSELVMLQLVVFAAIAIGLWYALAGSQSGAPDMREPFGIFNGVSAWPSQIIRTLVVVLFMWFLDYTWCNSASMADRLKSEYFPDEDASQDTARESAPLGAMARLVGALRNASIWFWQPRNTPGIDDPIDGRALWSEYRLRLFGWRRLGRTAMWVVLSMALIVMVIELVGGDQPDIPARGIADRSLFHWTILVAGTMVLTLLVLVGDVTVLTWRFINLLKRGRTIYPQQTVERFADALGPKVKALAVRRIAADVGTRNRLLEQSEGDDSRPLADGETPPQNTLIDDWIDMRLLADQTRAVGPLIVFPFILIGLMIVARSRLFDSWQAGGGLMIMFACFVLWSIGMAALLTHGADVARRMSLERMHDDQMWLKGAGETYKPLADAYPSLIEQVQSLRQGAFAPFFRQPSVQALLVPLGGAGGIQLLDYLLFAQR